MSSSAEALASDDVRFGPFFLNLSTRRLRHNAAMVPLKPKEAELLVLLATRMGKPVSRDDIMEALWSGQKATDYALSQTVYRLRRALEAFDATSDFVRTVPGIGYHLVAPIATQGDVAGLGFRDPAFHSYQQAMFRLKQRTQRETVASIGSFETALALNPDFVPALTGLAQVYTNAGIRSFEDPVKAYYRAKLALSKAIALEPDNADAYTTLSLLTLFFDADLAGARDAAEQAVLLTPRSTKSRTAMFWQLLARRDVAAALTEADLAIQANPSDGQVTALLGVALYHLQRYDEACLYFAESLQFFPENTLPIFYASCAQYLLGNYGEAQDWLRKMPGTEMRSRELAVLGCIAIRQGDERARAQAEAALASLPFRSDISIAAMHIANDDLDAAATSLTYALETREPGLFVPTVDPMYEPLQASHPLLMATIRKGRRACCDRCAAPLAQHRHRPYELSLCDACSAHE
jgi:DNA-binding winged helix-turn-helix (wHTH) protein/Tfp pilus assembly protein PilF